MENQMNIIEVIVFALTEPEYARPEYFKNKQAQSGFSETVFRKKLEDSISFWHEQIHKNDWRRLGGVKDTPQLSFFEATRGKIQNGHFGDRELGLLLLDIEKAFTPDEKDEKNKQLSARQLFIFFYLRDGRLMKSKHMNEIKQYWKGQGNGLRNDYSELEKFVRNELTDPKVTNFENIIAQIKNGNLDEKLKKLNLK